MYLASFFIFILTWLQPLHVLPWVSWHSEVIAFASLYTMSGCALYSRLQCTAKVEMPNVGWLALALFAIVVLQTLAGSIEFTGTAVVYAFYIFATLFALMLGFGSAGANKNLEYLATGMAAVGLANVGIALAQATGIDVSSAIVNPMGSRRPGGNLGQPNQLATLLLMSFVSIGYLKKINGISASFYYFLSVVLALGIAISESRTGFLSFIVVLIWQLRKVQNELRFHEILSSILLCSTFFLFWWSWPSLHDIYWVLGEGSVPSTRLSEGVGIRFQVWQQLLDAASQRPWFGWGLGNVAEAHNAVLHRYSQGAPFSYAHNLFIDLVVGIGFLLSISFVGLAVTWVFQVARRRPTTQTWYAIGALIPVGIHSMLEFPFAYAYFLFPAAFFIGVIERDRSPNAVCHIPMVVAGGLFAAIVFGALWTVVEYIEIEEDFRVARFEALHVGQTPDEYRPPNILLLTQLSSLLQATRTNPMPGMSVTQLESLRKATMYYPWTAIQNRYALALALNGNVPEAQRQLNVMRVMHGDMVYEAIRQNWRERAASTDPQLLGLVD